MIKYYYILLFSFCVLISQAQDLNVDFTKIERECGLAKASVTASTTSQPVNYLWSNGSITSNISDIEPGEYSVKVTANNGKDTTIYFTIEELDCRPYPETHFTPNGDGYNDTWSIGGITNFPEFDLFVYNRWGQQVHHQISEYIPWDGRSLGIPLPDATYYYILYFSKTDKNKFIKGPISIIR